MVDQTTLTDGRELEEERPGRAIRKNMADIGHDLTTLAEMQAQLFLVDMQQAVRRMSLPTGLALFAGALILACFPIALAGFAMLLITGAGWSPGAAFLLMALIGLVIGGLILVVAWFQIQRHLDVMNRSREEFQHNLQWVKDVLRRSGRAYSARECP